MTSSRPYLIRALHEWIIDNGMTPYVMADATAEGVEVPESAIQEGKITLNVSAQAVQGLHMDNDCVSCSARFGGVARNVVLPVTAVLAVYAKENGQGMMFPAEGPDDTDPESGDGGSDRSNKSNKGRGHLKVVK